MTEAYRRQLAAARDATAAPGTSVPVGRRGASGGAGTGQIAPVTGQRDTTPEQAGPKAGTPVKWEVAGALFAEQYPGMARVVVVLPATRLPELQEALGGMNQ